MNEVLLIASGKGGVGKTIFTANLGAVLARKGSRVALVDMNMGLRNLDICLGLENNVIYDVADALMDVCNIRQALIRDRRFPALYLIAAAQSREKSGFQPEQMKQLCLELKKSFDYILVDAPAGIEESLDLAAAGADRAVIVTVPEYAALRDADMTDRILENLGIQQRVAVVNKVKEDLLLSRLVPNMDDIIEALRIPVVGIIPYDENIHVSANNGFPLALAQENYIQKNFEKIANRIFD